MVSTKISRTPWTLRKSGEIRCTIRMELHVPKDLVTFIRENEQITEVQALFKIKDMALELDADHTIYYSPSQAASLEMTMGIIDKEDIDWYRRDLPDCVVYDGPDLVWS